METVKKILPLDQWKPMAILLLCCLFIVQGIVVLATGMATGSVELEFQSEFDSGSNNYTLAIVGSCFLFVLAALGLVGILLRQHALIILGTVLAIVFLVLCLVAMINSSYKLFNNKITELDLVVEEFVYQYGDEKINASKELTKAIDNFQKESKCCGWSGEDGQNFFLGTSWYAKINSSTPEGKPRKNLPDSCCVTVATDCAGTSTIKEAKDKGLVHSQDCLNLVHYRIKIVQLQRFIMSLLSLLIMIVFIIITTMYIIEIKKK